jgi:hypothetical protein
MHLNRLNCLIAGSTPATVERLIRFLPDTFPIRSCLVLQFLWG